MFAEGMDLLPGPVPGDLACLGWALEFCKQGATLCCSGGPCSEPTFLVCTWRRCLLSGLGDGVSNLLEIPILMEGVFSPWIEGAPSVLQELLSTSREGIRDGLPRSRAIGQLEEPCLWVYQAGPFSRFLPQECVITNFLVSSQFLK